MGIPITFLICLAAIIIAKYIKEGLMANSDNYIEAKINSKNNELATKIRSLSCDLVNEQHKNNEALAKITELEDKHNDYIYHVASFILDCNYQKSVSKTYVITKLTELLKKMK